MKDVYGTGADQRAKDRFLRADSKSDDKGMPLKTRHFMNTSGTSYQSVPPEQTRARYSPGPEYGGMRPQGGFGGFSPIDHARQQPQPYIGQQHGFQGGGGSPYSTFGPESAQGLPHRGGHQSQPWYSPAAADSQNSSPQIPRTEAGVAAMNFASPTTPSVSSTFVGQDQTGSFVPDGRHLSGGPGQLFQNPTQPNFPTNYDEAQHWRMGNPTK